MDHKPARRIMLCSEIVSLHLEAQKGRARELKGNLEEIWASGAVLWTEERIRNYTSLSFLGGGCQFRGQVVAQTLRKGIGYITEMRFHPSCRWSEQRYRPQHLFNPLVLLANRIFETTLCAAKGRSDQVRPHAFLRTAAPASFKSAYWG
ncbi:MAG: hypothetical protein ABI833_09905 [Acidobacteriota bacterium]